METIAKARFQRISPRKVRVLLREMQGRNVAEALELLRFSRKAGATLLSKLLASAVANVRQGDEDVDLDALAIRQAWADMAPSQHMRRWRPRAQGRATQIVKGMSHVTVVVSDQ